MTHAKNFLFTDTKRLVTSPQFMCSCAAFAICSIVGILDEIVMLSDSSVFYLYTVYFYYPFWILCLLFSVIPAITGFFSEWENCYYRCLVMRTGKKAYAITKMISCFVSSACVVAVGQGLFILALCARGPVFLPTDIDTLSGSIYEGLINGTDIWQYFVIRILLQAFGAGFFSVFALFIATKLENIFVVLASPIILYYLIENLSALFKLSGFLSIPKLLKGASDIKGGPWLVLLYAGIFFISITVAVGIAYYFSLKRRMNNA